LKYTTWGRGGQSGWFADGGVAGGGIIIAVDLVNKQIPISRMTVVAGGIPSHCARPITATIE
jgi:hypothetical protein